MTATLARRCNRGAHHDAPPPPKDCVSAFVKRITALDREKSPYDKFRDFCEMVFCAKAKRMAQTREPADELENRYMQIVGTYRDKDTVRAYPGLLALAANAIHQGCDFLGSVALCARPVPVRRALLDLHRKIE